MLEIEMKFPGRRFRGDRDASQKMAGDAALAARRTKPIIITTPPTATSAAPTRRCGCGAWPGQSDHLQRPKACGPHQDADRN